MEIRIDSLCKAFDGKQVLRDFSHSFAGESAHCILGASGCGKTTLLRLIAGLETPDSGSITGTEHKKISAVFQEDRLFENLSAEKNVLLTARRDFTRTDALQLLNELELRESAGMPVCSFSGGMKRRVAIARALAADYDLLILDEPFSGLDSDTRTRALETIARHAAGKTLICVTHEPADALQLGAEILRL